MQMMILEDFHLIKFLLLTFIASSYCLEGFTTYDQCGAEADAEKGIIKSPGYPKAPGEKTIYPDNQECLWRVDLGHPNTLFILKFMDLVTQFRLKPNNDTVCIDYVNITTESFGTEQYCGFKKPEELYRGVGPKMDVLFISDRRHGYRGFRLIYSATPDHDPCRDEPCKNGDCLVMEDRVRFECDCEPGFTGYTCQMDIDECESDPCKNGASCEQTEDPGYECFCTPEWQGLHCEIIRPPDPCLSNPCRNEGTCTASEDNNEFSCACILGYTGVTCRHDINECESNPCQNGGTCDNKVNEYECTCGRLYYGDNCENKQKINGCLEEPCSENGDCISTDDEGGYRCHCLDGYTGKHCDSDFEECSSNPCQNGGICDDDKEFNKFDCTCVGGYTGTLCEIAPPMCDNPGIPYVDQDIQWIEGSILQFYCIEGYRLEGPENLTCLKNESWSTELPECVVDRNTTDVTPTQSVSPWLGSMLALSGLLAVTLIAFVTWILLKGPWSFGSNSTKVVSLSQDTMLTHESSKC